MCSPSPRSTSWSRKRSLLFPWWTQPATCWACCTCMICGARRCCEEAVSTQHSALSTQHSALHAEAGLLKPVCLVWLSADCWSGFAIDVSGCLLYTSDAADEEDSVDLGGRRIIKKKT